ncbi:MAG: PEP-CTERM sorting domain-containing protein [Hormoscilla sp.]
MNAINKFSMATLSSAIVLSGTAASSVQAATLSPEPQPIDLSTWKQERLPTNRNWMRDNGNWEVSPDGKSVLQTINGKPTFFVSPDDFINTTINGKIKVETHIDDDLIGFVFGYQSPAVNQFDLMLFDWKQTEQTVDNLGKAHEGFSLAKVDETLNKYSPFWKRKNDTGFNVLASDYGSRKGWKDETEHDFTLLYQSDRVKIDIDGKTIFDISADEVGGEFQAGRFGFYNFSQGDVLYSGFTQNDIPPTPSTPSTPPKTVPEPSSGLGLLAFGAVGAGSLLKRKLQKKASLSA